MTPPAFLAASLYEALKDHPACWELDNEQIEAIAHAAAEHLETEGYRVVKQEQVGVWSKRNGFFPLPDPGNGRVGKPVWRDRP